MLKLLPFLESGPGAALTSSDLLSTIVIGSFCQAGSLIVPVCPFAVALAPVNVTVPKLASVPVPSIIHSAELRMGFELGTEIVYGLGQRRLLRVNL